MRRPEEALIVVHRDGPEGREFLVVERAPDRQGYWHVVAGALEWGESAADAQEDDRREQELQADDLVVGREDVFIQEARLMMSRRRGCWRMTNAHTFLFPVVRVVVDCDKVTR